MHDDHDTDHSQTDLTTNPKDNTNNGDIDIETDILQLTGEELESTYPNNRYFGQVHENFEIPAREEETVPAGDVLPQDRSKPRIRPVEPPSRGSPGARSR